MPAPDKIDQLYDALKADGAVSKSRENFRSYMLASGEQGYRNRKQLYDALKADGAVESATYEEFRDRLGLHAVKPQQPVAKPSSTPQPVQKPAPAPAPAQPVVKQTTGQVNPTVNTSTQPKQDEQPQKKGGGYKPSPSSLWKLHSSMRAYNEGSRRMKEQVHRAVGAMTPAGRQQAKAGKMAAQMAGTPSRVMGLTPPVPKGDMAVGAEAKQQKLPTRGATPYDVVVEDGERKTRWLLPDGRLTTDLLEADRSEYAAVKGRLNEAFRQRMRSGGLDPDSSDDVQTQAMRDLFSRHDADDAAAKVWEAAEARTAEALRETESNPFLTALPQAEVARAIEARSADMTHHDLQRMADEAWDMLGKERQDAIIDDLATALGKGKPGVDEQEVMATAAKIARAQSDRSMVDYAIKMNAPQSATEFFIRKAVGTNAISSLIDAASRVQAGTRGDMLAREGAESEYERGHRVAGIGGTVTGFMFDPLMLISGGVGGSAVKGASWLGGKMIGEAAMRKFGTTLGGRMLGGSIGGAANFATFEGLGEGLEQLRMGGYRDPENGEVGGYSMGAIGDRAAHGLMMGAATGMVAPLLGNVSDKLVRATESTVGKMGIRAGELGVGTVAEGTIFAVPEIIDTYGQYGDLINSLSDESSPNYIADEQERAAKIEELRNSRGDAMMDVWTDNMAMIAGFKAQHLLKSAPRVIYDLARSKNSKAGFETRLRSILDGRGDLALTADEKAELERGGYGDLNELVEDYGRYEAKKAQEEAYKGKRGDVAPDRLLEEGELPDGVYREIPYNRFTDLMTDGNISEAARAKMYYYLTGHTLPMSTVIASSDILENKDADGNVKSYTVQSYGGNGVITSRTFTSRKSAEAEQNRINRQAELNGFDVGERYYDWQGDNKRMYEACESVAEETGAPANLLFDLMKRKTEAMNEVELEWAEKILNAYNGLGDKYGSLEVRAAINDEFGVDIDKAVKKEPFRRSGREQKAVEEYANRLFADVKFRQEEAARNSEPRDPNAPTTNSQTAALLGFDDSDPADPSSGMSAPRRRGYNAGMQERQDIAIELADPNNAEAQEAWNGVVQRINEDAAYMVAQQREQTKQMQHTDGSLRPAILKEKDSEGNDQQVYIVDGNVQMMPDGSMVDKASSDNIVVVYNPATGERKQIDPTADTGISSLGEVTTAEQREADIERSRQEYVQAQIDEAQGTVRFVPGQQLVLPTGEEGVVVATDADGEDITVALGDGTQATVQRSELQRIRDEKAAADYRQRHGITEEPAAQQPEASTPVQPQADGRVAGAPSDYTADMELTIRDEDGSEKPAMVMGRVRYENGSFVPDANGNIIEYFMDGEVKHDHEDKLVDKVVSHVAAQQLETSTPVEEASAETPATVETTPPPARQQAEVAPQPVQEPVQTAEPQPAQPAEAPAQPTEQPTAEPMPVGEDGEEDWQATTPERAHAYIFNEAGLSRSEGNEFIAAQTQAAQSALVKAKSAQMPRVGTSIKKYNEAKAKRQEKIDEAQRVLDYWQQVRNIQNDIQREENERRASEDAVRHDEAVAEAQAEYEARKQAEAERKAVGNENPMPAITEKWNNATKVDGHRDEIVLSEGERVKGHYVLHESGASSPSHNPETWQKTDGFPMDANGNTVNDRDYERDRDAQEHTQSIARQYDQRAMQGGVPVVSNDGVVLSGNGRTMAGELAARDNTDGAYVNYLKEYAPKFGFTAEQVEAMQHPRVSFVPDEAMPYTAETFAKFNQQEMKSQNKTEQAVKLGKTVSDDSFKGIVRTINGYDTLGDFYNDAQASLGAVYDLHNAGVVPQAQLAEMVDGIRGQEKLSAVGRQFLENMLIGKAFESDPEVVRMLTAEPAMRQTVITALGEIVDNIALGGDWSLREQLAGAVKLCYDALDKGAKYGDIVSMHARQGVLFADPDELQTVADFNNATMLMLADVLNDKRVTLLKTTLQLYNNNARQSASGQPDLFTGGIHSREDILRDVITFINENYGKRKEIEAARAAAVERRKAESVQQDGTPPAVNSGSEDTGRSERGSEEIAPLTHDEAITIIAQMEERAEVAPEIELTIENWDALFGEEGRVLTPIGEVKMGENQFTKLMRQGREGKLGMIKPTLENPDVIIEDASEAKDGETTERKSSYVFVKAFKKADGSRYYYFTSITVSKDGREVVVSNQEKSRNRLLRLMTEGKMLWRTPKDATTASVEQQGLDYAQPSETETATKGSGITPQSTDMSPSASKGSENSATVQENGEKKAENQTPIQGLDGYTEDEVLSLVRGDIEEKLADAGIDGVTIKGMALHGSRLRGDAREDSDLDVVVEYEGDMSEDGLFNILNNEPMEIEGVRVDVNPITSGKSGTLDQYMERSRQFDALKKAEQETNTAPTEAQKEAGNYKKGHVRIDGFDVTIEQPKGSVRRGTDASGKQWEQEMHNTYGYIRGTEGVDGDHIDVFFSDDPSQGDVFVVDQVNKDGSFDEHKVMYGFPDIESARKAYLSNYEDGWQGLGAITPVSKEEFKKWIDSSHRKTKPFAEYSSVKPLGDTQLGEQPNKPTVKAGEDYVSAAERIAKEHEVKRTAAHFAEETQEEATAFDKLVPEMDDAELLAYMQEDGMGDVNKAHHPSVYDEYDYRHGDEQLQSYDATLVRLNESGTTLEQAEEMLANLQKDVSRFATDERAELLGQEEALQEYIAVQENRKEEMDEVTAVPQQTEQASEENAAASEYTTEKGNKLSVLRSKYPDRVFGEQHEDGSVTFHDEDALLVSQLIGREFDGEDLTLAKEEADKALQKLIANGHKVAFYGTDYKPKYDEHGNRIESNPQKVAKKPAASKKASSEQTGKIDDVGEVLPLAGNGHLLEKEAEKSGDDTHVGYSRTLQSSDGTLQRSVFYDGKRIGVQWQPGERLEGVHGMMRAAYGEMPEENFDLLVPQFPGENDAWEIDGRDVIDLDHGDVVRFHNEKDMVDFYLRNRQEIDRRIDRSTEPQPIGRGAFGNIYDQFKGKAKEAIAFLLQKKEGEAVAALHHKDIGDIDLVWGEEGTGKSDGFGLAKLAKYHPEVLDNLQELLDDMHVVQRSENRVRLESDTHQAAVRLDWDNQKKNWLLTAFEKKNSALDNTTDTGKTLSSNGNDTATPESTVSGNKGTKKSGTVQGRGVKSHSSGKIEDFGEKIGGARKDLARGRIRDAGKMSVKDLTTLKNGADGILSQASILRLHKDGQMDESTARRLMALNSVIKGALGGRLLENIRGIALEKYRDAAVAWEEGRPFTLEITDKDVESYKKTRPNASDEKMRDVLTYYITDPLTMYMLTYEALNFPAEERKLGRYVIVDYSKMQSDHVTLTRHIWVKNGWSAKRGYPFETMSAAVGKMKSLCPVVEAKEKKPRGEKAEHGLHVVKDGPWYYVKSRNIPGNIYLSQRFVSQKQAQSYLEENLERLAEREQLLVDALMGSNIGMAEREGVDYRGGRDVTPQDFLDEFGFRGVEFGNWVPQGERQLYLNKTYDAIKDFCAIVGISPKAFSLGGRLGLAFGARGHSRAMAHYEPAREVINLTRMSGVGSLAHEWFHALDNYLAKQKSGNTSDMATVTHDVVREELSQVFKELHDVMKGMDYHRRSRSGGEYWGRTWEEMARLFESYIYNKLAAKEASSPVLVRKEVLLDDAPELMRSSWPYPSSEENAKMEPMFDRLFDTIQERTDDDGHVVLFQKAEGSTLAKEQSNDTEGELALRDGLVELMRGAGIEVVTDVAEGQRVLEAAKRAEEALAGMDGIVQAAKRTASLQDAESFVEESLQGKRLGQTLEIVLPEPTRRKVERAMGRDFDSHSITANSIVHSKKNHGVGGRKNTGSSIPLRDEDFKLAPYIMVNPDRVEKGSWDASGRESIRFIKNLSNGYVIVVEKEQKNSPDDMETITMWAEKSSRVADARSSASPAIDVQNVVTSFDAAKIRKDGETASKDSEKIKPHRVWHGSGAEFDAFDHSHMGEGEGAQAYGWGTYVTEVEGIGRAYARSSGGRRVFYDGREVDPHSRGTLAEQCYAAVARRVLDGKMTAGEYIADRLAHYDMQLVHLRESGGEQFIADTEKLRDVFASMDADRFELVEGPAVLYEVEIPDNDGGNYLQYDKQMGAQGDALERIDNELTARGWHRSEQNDVQVQNQIVRFEKDGKDIILRPVQQGRDLYFELENGLGSARSASEFLRDCSFTGIVYPAEYRSGGRRDGAKNYVIFDEGDLRIEERTRLLRTSQGEVYGFVKGGKIYLDPRIATAETAVHEYTHLWCAALRAVNPAAWSRLKEVLLGEKDVVDYVKRLYPELALSREGTRPRPTATSSQGGTRPRPTATPSNLEGELGDELMEEVMAHYSGKRGAERLRREREREMAKAKGILGKARVAALFDRLRRLLDNFWLAARHLFAGKVEGVERLSAADFADMALGDLLRGFNPGEEVRKLRGDAHKAAQLRLVTAVNPMEDTYHTGIRSIDDIKTFAEAVDEGEGIDSYPDFTEDDALVALERGRAVVYSSYPIVPGVFVSMSRMEAEEYAGGGEVYSMEVPLEDVAWIYASEGQYAPVEGSTNGGLRKSAAAPTFYSNAERAVEGVRQEKAKAEQWKAMLTKGGGIKAGEDKWMGLSQWLDEHKGETLTKAEVLEFVRRNGVQMEERHYGELDVSGLQKEFDEIYDRIVDGSAGGDAVTLPREEAWEELRARHHGGDDFDMAFSLDERMRIQVDDEGAAGYFLGTDPINSTRLDYTTEGLENKREIAFVVPDVDAYQEDDEVHFGPENEGKAVMWVRFGETTDRDGRRVLVIDEIQSNRHQDAREQGYMLAPRWRTAYEQLRKRNEDLMHAYYGRAAEWANEGGSFEDAHKEDARAKALREQWDAAGREMVAFMEEHGGSGSSTVPAAPFEKNWHEVAMKRMLRLAAEEGFDKVAWTTGMQQAERYDLGKMVDEIRVIDASDGVHEVMGFKDGKRVFDRDVAGGERGLSELIGKDMARKAYSNLHEGRTEYLVNDAYVSLTGKDLAIGGEGMKGFYDQMLPRFMDKYGKRWGVRTGKVELPGVGDSGLVMHSVDVTAEMRRSVLAEGQPLFQKAGDSAMLSQKTEEDLDKEYMDALNVVEKPERIEKLRRSEPVKITGEEIALSDEDSDDVTEDTAKYRIREDEPPTKTGIGYKVFVLKDGKLYPPMVANPNGEATPVGVWLDADAAPVAGVTKTGRQQVKAGGKGTQGGSGKLAYRPGWHLGEIPYALQFNRMNPETGQRELFPANFVWAEVEYANDVDYQEEAMSYGMNASGKFQHSLAGLPRLPENGSYRYRTNPDPNTDPWVITGAMKVNRILKPSEVDAMVEAAGREPQQRQAGAITDEQVEALNAKVKRTMQEDRDMMRRAVEQAAAKLGAPVDVYVTSEEVTHSDAEEQANRRRAKGWWDPKTGRIGIVLGNHRDVDDALATMGHETVAHYGLHEMIGEERYNEFLDEVYAHLRDDLKKGVDDAAGRSFIDDTTKNGKRAKSYEHHRRTAVDELFGRLAEKPFEEFNGKERNLWQWLKAKVRHLLNRFLGSLKLPKWFELGDNELRYILWRSKERLERGKEHPIDLARDIVKREELGLTDEARYNMGEVSEPSFAARRDRAVKEHGYVHPGLNSAEVKVVSIKERTPFDTSKKTKALKEDVVAYANEHGIIGTMTEEETKGKGQISISKTSIEKMVDDSATSKSVDKDTHLAVIPQLREVIAESVMAETHPDYNKGRDGKRSPENGYNPDNLIHRCYGAISVDGQEYRVKLTLKETSGNRKSKKAYSYEVTKIEVLDGQTTKPLSVSSRKSNTSNGRSNVSDVFVSGAKLLNNLEKSYDSGNKILDESLKADDLPTLYRDPDETEDIWRDGSMGLQERITAAATRLANNHRDNKTLRNDAMRAIGGNLSDLRKAMSLQRTFDMTTVKRVADLARVLMNNGYLNGLTQQEVKRLLAAVKNSVGHNDIEGDVQKVMDIMVDNQLKHAEDTLHELEAIRGSKVDARGVEVQGQLDPAGAHTMKVFKNTRGWEKTDIEEAISEAQQRMGSSDVAVADEAALEYTGLQLALEYAENIKDSKVEERKLREEIKQAHDDASERDRATDSYRQYIASLQEAIRQNKIERAQSYFDLVGRLTDSLRESIANAKAFKEAEKQRIREIQHKANSDMEGRPSDEHYKPTFADKFVNNSFVSFLFAPLATFDQMLPRFMDKYGKKWGVKTGEVRLSTPGGEVMHSVDVTAEMRRSVLAEGQPLFHKAGDGGLEAVKDEVLNYFHSAVAGNEHGKGKSIGKLTASGRAYLESISGLKLKEDVDFVLNPSDLRHIHNDHYGVNEKDKGNNVPLTDDDIRKMVDVISSPERVICGTDKKTGNKVFIFLSSNPNGTYNLAEVYTDRRGNLTAKSFYNTKKTISQRANELLTSSPRLTSATEGASSSSTAKVPILFDMAKENGENVAAEGCAGYREVTDEEHIAWLEKQAAVEE